MISVHNPEDAGFGVYVHWPFCASKCPYCDFNSHVRPRSGTPGGVDERRFLAAYLTEIERTAAEIGRRSTGSVFFGGGTPSLMSPGTVAAIIEAIDRQWPIRSDAEITLEANPSSVEAGRFAGYRAAGVNRVSLGVQSLDDDVLKSLGRLHDVAEARTAIEIARRTFERFSFDLIYARPKQALAAWRDELGRALQLAERHLSLYQLTIEDGTPFAALHASGKLKVPDDQAADDLYELTQDMTAAAGLAAYEISNHAAPGEEARHNLLYWRYGEYAGVGAGAHGRLMIGSQRYATAAERLPERWLERVEAAGHGHDEPAALTPGEQADEALLMGLRLNEGFDLGRLRRLAGSEPAPAVLDRLVRLGMIERPFDGVTAGDCIRATPRGRFVLNEIVRQVSDSLTRVAA